MQINPKQKILKKRKNISVIENGKAIEKNQQKTKNFIYVKEIEKTWKNDKEKAILQLTVLEMRVGALLQNWQEYWSGYPCPSPGDLPDSGIESGSPALQADSLPTEL